MVLGSALTRSRRSRNRSSDSPCVQSPMVSNPESGPSWAKERELGLRTGARWSCMAQPRSVFPAGEVLHEEGREGTDFGSRSIEPGSRIVEDGDGGLLATGLGRTLFHSVVGEPAADRVEVVVTFLEGFQQGSEIRDLDGGDFTELITERH